MFANLPETASVAFDPWAAMRRMQDELDRIMQAADSTEGSVGGWPCLNVYGRGDDGLMVIAAVPGVEQEHLEVSVVGDVLRLRGKRERKGIDGELTWYRHERPMGEFSRTIELPFRVDPDKVEASYANGVLAVRLERLEADKPKKITVHAA